MTHARTSEAERRRHAKHGLRNGSRNFRSPPEPNAHQINIDQIKIDAAGIPDGEDKHIYKRLHWSHT